MGAPPQESQFPKSMRLRTPSELLEVLRLGVRQEIQESRRLLQYEDDWDGEGSPGYLEATWQETVEFVLQLLARLADEYAVRHQAMEIMPGTCGNIDVEIEFADHRLLFSVPRDPGTPIRFFAYEVATANAIKGTLGRSAPIGWLLQWISE